MVDWVAVTKMCSSALQLLPRLFSSALAVVRARSASRAALNGHFDKTLIKRTVKAYVRPEVSSSDPSESSEPGDVRFVSRQDALDVLLESVRSRHLVDRPHALILADSGMGKTSLMINAAWFIKKKLRLKAQLVALGTPNADEVIAASPDKRRTVLLLDGLDEDTKAVGRLSERLRQLVVAAIDYYAVVISCRTQFFDSAKDVPLSIDLPPLSPRPAGNAGVVKFRHLYLMPFSGRQIEQYLIRKFGILNFSQRRKARDFINRVPALAVRPMLLEYLQDLLDRSRELAGPWEIYGEIVDAWIERERHWIEGGKLLKFSLACAANLYASRKRRGVESASAKELSKIAVAHDLELSSYQAEARSLLNRTQDGRFKFAHRSIMEYLVVRGLRENFVSYAEGEKFIEATDQMKSFFWESIGGRLDTEQEQRVKERRLHLSSVAPVRHQGVLLDWSLYEFTGVVCGADFSRIYETGFAHGQNRRTRLNSLLAIASTLAEERDMGKWIATAVRIGARWDMGVADGASANPIFIYERGVVWGACIVSMVQVPLDTYKFAENALYLLPAGKRAAVVLKNLGRRELDDVGRGEEHLRDELRSADLAFWRYPGVGFTFKNSVIEARFCSDFSVEDEMVSVGMLLGQPRIFKQVPGCPAIWWALSGDRQSSLAEDSWYRDVLAKAETFSPA